MTIFKKLSAFMLAIMLLSTSCQENYLDINEDPNNPANATVETVLPAAINSVAFTIGGQWQILGELWAQHWTQSPGANQYANIDNYNINETTFNRQYIEIYAGALNDFNYVSKTAEENNNWNYYLIAEVMKAYTFQIMVDLYDDIPYTEALSGLENKNPKFDKGANVYADLIKKIDNALSKDLSAATSKSLGKEDIIFQGVMDNWIRFANTLKLKIYMRQSEINPSVASAGITSLFQNSATFLNTDAEMAEFIDVQNFRNPFYAAQVSSAGSGRGYTDIVASNTLLNYLQNNGDPRLDAIYSTPKEGGAHVGINQGDYTNASFKSARELSQPNIAATTPVVLISAAESKFLQAEAVIRYSVAGDAEQLYNEGIEESFAKLEVDNASNYYGTDNVYEFPSTSPEDQLDAILTQKWIAFANYQGLEAHFEHLRTGYPNFLTATPNNVTGDVSPKRLPYPTTELNNNSENVQQAGGQKQVIERIWWDPS
ncbi:SusD/RagB family nutrient-binding outer membrane lipoprotein [Fulvivirga sediminis]|uniref:SusD/RagB family nutrient-binding outer membrane lipoprotein n=1 Tax=Fulvivirga sediminis TaxID=2803949 RepID=A0A937FAE2_9BACT|nr:SusD/RagB family nutrient-binding outer membrane lipoprotein [Fulvivirga sediminis]MBL3656868.1 SusD/RagB family nutrient-binding outer membrane lipoprotein [Fulvivirga sediminis]